MGVLTNEDVVAIREQFDRAVLPHTRHRMGMCIFWAGLTLTRLLEQGHEAVIVAGSATFPAAADTSTIPEPYPTHGSYTWEETEEADGLRLSYAMRGILPELHAWVACKSIDGYNFVDLSIKYVPEYFTGILPVMQKFWTWQPPDYLDVPARDVLTGGRGGVPLYVPNKRATVYAFKLYCKACTEMDIVLPKSA